MSLSPHIKNRLDKLLVNTLDLALKRRARLVVEELSPQKDEVILDAGCGDGYYLYLLSSLGIPLRLVGVDNDERAIESASNNLKDKKIKLINANLNGKLTFKSQSFDKIVMSEVAEHLPNDVKGLKEVYRVLRPGGILCLTVPSANYPFLWDPINWTLEHLFKTHIKSGFWAGIWNQHRRLYKPWQIGKVLQKAGFIVERAEFLTFWSIPFNHNIVNLGARILASKITKSAIIEGANKFSTKDEKSTLVKIFFFVSNFVDKLNDFWSPNQIGVSIFLKARRKG